mgnify:CR=1 FL=1
MDDSTARPLECVRQSLPPPGIVIIDRDDDAIRVIEGHGRVHTDPRDGSGNGLSEIIDEEDIITGFRVVMVLPVLRAHFSERAAVNNTIDDSV